MLCAGTAFSNPQVRVCQVRALQSSAPMCGGGGVIERIRRDKTPGTKWYAKHLNKGAEHRWMPSSQTWNTIVTTVLYKKKVGFMFGFLTASQGIFRNTTDLKFEDGWVTVTEWHENLSTWQSSTYRRIRFVHTASCRDLKKVFLIVCFKPSYFTTFIYTQLILSIPDVSWPLGWFIITTTQKMKDEPRMGTNINYPLLHTKSTIHNLNINY